MNRYGLLALAFALACGNPWQSIGPADSPTAGEPAGGVAPVGTAVVPLVSGVTIVTANELAGIGGFPGYSATCLSADVVAEVMTGGDTPFYLGELGPSDQIDEQDEQLLGEWLTPGQVEWVQAGLDRATAARLVLVSEEPVSMPVLLNGKRVELEALHLRLEPEEGGYPSEWWVAPNGGFPLLMASHIDIGKKVKQAGMEAEARSEIIRITTPQDEQPGNAVEQALERDKRVELDGIYFDFGSDALRPESAPALKAAADALSRNPAWKVSVEGHTDAVGSDETNLDLSRRRAAAVRDALTSQYGIAPERLSTAGFGETRPLETNETMAGRARNRRVELVRP